MSDAVQRILFLPNIELRTSIIVRDPKGKDSRVTFHVIFSDEVSIEDIGEHFIRELKFTAEGNPDSTDEKWSLTIRNLEELGKRLKAQHEKFRSDSDQFVGMMNAVIDHGESTRILDSKPSIFKDQYLFCLPSDEDLSKCSWDGQGHLTRKVLIQKSHLLFSPNEGTRDFALGRKHPTLRAFIDEFKTLKPCIHSSDAHTYAELFAPKEERHTWIKADPTFQGLRQLLNEPVDRVFIGTTPPNIQRVTARSTRVIRNLKIEKIPGAPITEKWFDAPLVLNSELISIIGNKGSGKSALADIIGLLGNTPRHGSFSFLSPDRFRDPKNNKAKHFQASLTWADDTTEGPISLDCDPDTESIEKIKYIPQNYLEEICNEIGLGKGNPFYAELQQVIFSHVPKTERLGLGTLDELLDYRGEEIRRAIELLVSELQELNKQIVMCEDRLSIQYRKTLDAQLTEKRRELEAHEQTKPKKVVKPEEDLVTQQQSKMTSEELEQKQTELKGLEEQLAELNRNDTNLVQKRATAERLLTRIENLQRYVTTLLNDSEQDFTDLDLNADAIVSLKVNAVPIAKIIKDIDVKRATISKQLDKDEKGSVEYRRLAITTEIENLKTKLSAPQREYQTYLQKLKEWETSKGKIVGSVQTVGSILHLEQLLADLADLPKSLLKLQGKRYRKALEILREKQKLRAYYANYYGAVQDFLIKHPLSTSKEFKLTFNETLVDTGFADDFLSRINQRKIGPFAGVEEGGAELKRLLDATNWESASSVLRFTRSLLKKMMIHAGQRLEIKEQLKQGSTQDLYDFIFSFRYLAPIYRLAWGGKGLEQLSPGERGNLLLIFYLLLDLDDIPLVIDQPEENLDNQTVFKILVPCIMDAKKRRQIIMVTHNPNIAVVCDAEQIIYAEIHKELDNEVTYISGSIEDTIINKKILDVLEGTRPAFDKRDAKYLP